MTKMWALKACPGKKRSPVLTKTPVGTWEAPQLESDYHFEHRMVAIFWNIYRRVASESKCDSVTNNSQA